jgi:Asp-tRNA(Asn)/Glu-tRNA(Gln) amidotransferase C subunit
MNQNEAYQLIKELKSITKFFPNIYFSLTISENEYTIQIFKAKENVRQTEVSEPQTVGEYIHQQKQ